MTKISDEHINDVHEIVSDFIGDEDFTILTDFNPRVVFDTHPCVEVKLPVIRDQLDEAGYETTLSYDTQNGYVAEIKFEVEE